MRFRPGLLTAAVLAVAPAVAEVPIVVSSAAEDIAVTIYGDDLALVRETRTVALPEGDAILEFRGVSDAIIPQAAIVEGLGGIVERNFDYDVLSPYALVSRAIGGEVTLVRTNPGTGAQTRERARVVSGGRGVVLDFGAGRIEAVECSGLPEGLVFDSLPPGSRPEPTLSARIHNERSGEQTLTLVYLAHGISWQADYNLRMAPGGEGFDLEAWLTLSNTGETTFAEAETAVVAGELNRQEDGRELIPREWLTDHCWAWGRRWEWDGPEPAHRGQNIQDVPMAVEAFSEGEAIVVTAMKREATITEAQREELLDYHFYRVPWRTTVAAKQSKQVRFMTKRDVRGEWLYLFEAWAEAVGDRSPEPATTVLRFENEKENHLGEPLPGGMVRVTQATSDGEVVLLGGDWISNSAVGIPVEVDVGESPKVMQRLRVTEYEEEPLILRSLLRGERIARITATVEDEITNARPTPVLVEVLETSAESEPRISRASHPWKKVRGVPTWRIEVPANASIQLRYRLHWDESYR